MENNILIILSFKNFRDEEFNIPIEFFRKKGFNITLASNKAGKARGMKGTEVEIFNTIDTLEPEKYDAIILVGGTGSEVFWNDKTLHSFLKKANQQKKIIAASYKSPITLAYAGILKNKRATVWIGDRDIIDELGAYYTGSSIEIDGNIITTDGPHSTKMFAEEIYNQIKKNHNES